METRELNEKLANSNKLSPREMEVLLYLLDGKTNKETARALNISYRTVEVHRQHIMLKFGAKNAADLVRISILGS